MPKMCDFTDRGDCAAIAGGCICADPGYQAAKRSEMIRRDDCGAEWTSDSDGEIHQHTCPRLTADRGS